MVHIWMINLIAMVYSAVVVVMMRIVYKIGENIHKNKQNQNSMRRDLLYFSCNNTGIRYFDIIRRQLAYKY